MKAKDIRKVLRAARRGPYSQVLSDLIPGWEYRKLSNVIAYCNYRGLVEAIEVTSFDSPHREFILRSITAAGEDYLETRSIGSLLRKSATKVYVAVTSILGIAASILAFATREGRYITHQVVHRVAQLIRNIL